MRLILASTSPRRKDILADINLRYTVVAPDCDEVTNKTMPEDIVLDLSKKKALNVASRIDLDATIIAADTIVYHNGKILEKPKDIDEAFKMLSQLQGNWHTVYTGVCIIKENKEIINYFEESKVHMRKATDEQIRKYIKDAKPFDKAGAYGIQDDKCDFVDKVKGEIETVIGLPVIRLKHELNLN